MLKIKQRNMILFVYLIINDRKSNKIYHHIKLFNKINMIKLTIDYRSLEFINQFTLYLIDGCVNILGAVCVTRWSTRGRPDLLVQGAGAWRAT